jgi:outer membrane protein TolC
LLGGESQSSAPASAALAALQPIVRATSRAPLQEPVEEVSRGAASAATSQSVEQEISLETLLAEAEKNNPGIQATLRVVEAKRARVPQARAYPDPMVSFGYMGNLIPPFTVQQDDPSSYRMIEASQEIPFPGKRGLRGQIASKEADAAWWEYENARRRVASEVKVAYYDLYYVHKAIVITEKNRDLLDKLAKIAEEKYKVGKGIQQDVLKAQVEISRLLQRLTVLDQLRRTAEARINTLLYRPADTPLGVPAEVRKSPLVYSLEELTQRAAENYPELRRQQEFIEQSQFAVNLAQREYYPDFSVAFSYQNRTSGLPEMWGARFTATIPIFYKSKQREAVNEATSTLAAVKRAEENVRTEMFYALKEQYLMARASEALADLYAKAVVPQSTLALESSLASYEVGAVDFLTMLNNFTTVLDYETNYYQELTNYQKALARIEPIVGMSLTK